MLLCQVLTMWYEIEILLDTKKGRSEDRPFTLSLDRFSFLHPKEEIGSRVHPNIEGFADLVRTDGNICDVHHRTFDLIKSAVIYGRPPFTPKQVLTYDRKLNCFIK